MDIRRLGRDHVPGLPPRLAVGLAALGVAATVLMSGCSINRALRPDRYTVQRGDTLSEIAQHYHLNWHNLARWNHIGPPYRIRVGQQLTLKPYPRLDYAHMSGPQSSSSNAGGDGGAARSAASSSSSNGHVQPLQSPGTPTVTRGAVSDSSVAPDHASNSSASSDTGQSSAAEQANSREENSIDHASSSATTRKTTVKAGGPSADGWQWPASGSLLRAYDPSARRRGIEIGGKVGSPIYAASSGTVVYNGSGLKGYGKLIIIKHNEHYLSAYGFIERSRVKQGETVQAGAHIADMGLGPENKPMLHFEIRKDGDPINPQKVLPDH